MKKNKGFTLVELLVVIVVLGLLILLAMPSVLNAMESSAKNVFSSQVIKFADDAKATYEQVKMDEGAATPTCYNVDGLKPGTAYKGTINIGADGQVSAIYIFDKDYKYSGSLSDLVSDKGKAVDKIANAAQLTSLTNVANTSTTGANAASCPKPSVVLAP